MHPARTIQSLKNATSSEIEIGSTGEAKSAVFKEIKAELITAGHTSIIPSHTTMQHSWTGYILGDNIDREI